MFSDNLGDWGVVMLDLWVIKDWGWVWLVIKEVISVSSCFMKK